MKKKTLISALLLSAITVGIANAAVIDNGIKNYNNGSITNPTPVTAYLLMDKTTLPYLNDLLPKIASGSVKFNRLVLSFVNPNFDMATFNKSPKDLDQLLQSAGILAAADVHPGDGQRLQAIISALHQAHIQVYFAVGGWAYSCYDKNSIKGNCTANYPLTTDMNANLKAAVPGVDVSNLSVIQPISSETTQDFTTAWVNLVKAFGGDGIDVDYEENWFASETTYYYGQSFRPALPTWAAAPNGPFILPLSVVKYATFLKETEISSQAAGLHAPTTAAPAPAAYDIHSGLGGSMYWCPVQGPGGAVCGQPTSDRSNVTSVAGALKGVLYDMAHYTDSTVVTYAGGNRLGYADLKDSQGKPLLSGVIAGLDSVNVMTYDLDDGYDGVGSSWCIGRMGNSPTGTFTSRDPNTQGYYDIDCSLVSQTKTLVEMFKQQVIGSYATHLGFGIEAGFPNYPINIDDSLPGGGNAKQADVHYRWNDKFVAFDLPLVDTVSGDDPALKALSNTSQTSDLPAGAIDNHSSYLILNQDFFAKMKTAGADGFILWSLNNADYNEHVSNDVANPSWDFTQFSKGGDYPDFGNAAKKFGYNKDVLGALFKYSASPEQVLQETNKYFVGQ